MIKVVGSHFKNVAFSQNGEENKNTANVRYEKDTVLKPMPMTNLRIGIDKVGNTFTEYLPKGLSGDKDSNFYQFLTTGTFPYIAGSLTMMAVFNSANKFFARSDEMKANKLGNKMALGVLFYGLAKNFAPSLVSKPVKMATGVDVDMPYAKVVYTLPKFKGDTDIMHNEYHKVFESIEFPRWDLLYNPESSGKPRNAYYDKIAKKMGMGENLKDSDQEVKPKIKEVVTKTSAVSRLTQYLWAGLGVAVAMQKPWESFFEHTNLHSYKVNAFVDANKDKSFIAKLAMTAKNTALLAYDTTKSFGKTFVKSVKELYNPTEGEKVLSKVQKHAGKAFILTTFMTTLLGTLWASHVSHKSEKVSGKVIDNSRKFTVD